MMTYTERLMNIFECDTIYFYTFGYKCKQKKKTTAKKQERQTVQNFKTQRQTQQNLYNKASRERIYRGYIQRQKQTQTTTA